MERSAAQRRQCILVVDDDVHQHGILRVLLGRYGYDSIHVATLDDARAVLADEQVDLVVLDIRLHREHGLDLLFSMPLQGIEVPVIVCTSDAFAEFTYGMAKKAAAGWIVKRFNLREFIELVQRVIGAGET